MSYKRSSVVQKTILLSLLGLFLSACDIELEQAVDSQAVEDLKNPPTVTMDLPLTLTGSVSAGAAPSIRAGEGSACDFNGAEHGNWMNDGYTMAKFLVGLSNQQSCVADMVIRGVTEFGASFVNQGVQSIPADPNDPGAPTHFVIKESGGSYHVWLYFFQSGVTLPSDTSDIMTMYMTWTTQGDMTTGQFIMPTLPADVSDPNAPNRLRMDFVRGSSAPQDNNTVYLGFPQGHAFGIDGFRVEVGYYTNATTPYYMASGLMSMTKQPMPNLPGSETYSVPSLGMVAYADLTGAGAAIGNWQDFAWHIGSDATFSLGTYEYTMENRTYFDVAGATEWQRLSATSAEYVNSSGTNSRYIEQDGVDTTSTTMDTIAGLMTTFYGSDYSTYFIDTCSDTAGAECADFIQWILDDGFGDGSFGGTNSAAADEPADDGRKTIIDSAVQLTEVWPTGYDAVTAFEIPQP